MRKIIQITSFTPEWDGEQFTYTHALCDDGSLWELSHNTNRWSRLPPIPQDDAEVQS